MADAGSCTLRGLLTLPYMGGGYAFPLPGEGLIASEIFFGAHNARKSGVFDIRLHSGGEKEEGGYNACNQNTMRN